MKSAVGRDPRMKRHIAGCFKRQSSEEGEEEPGGLGSVRETNPDNEAARRERATQQTWKGRAAG